jgi:hypothetical protein
MENQNLETSFERNNTLTVLCVLTAINALYWLSSAIGTVINSITGSASSDTKAIEDIERTIDELPEDVPEIVEQVLLQIIDIIEVSIAKAIEISVLEIGVYAGLLAGATLMWFGKRIGFYVYAVASIFMPLSVFLFYGSSMASLFVFGLYLFSSLLFTGLYATQLKRLR